MKVFINPGHAPNGIPDPGAVNPTSGRRECDIVYKIAGKVREYLTSMRIMSEVLQSDSLAHIVTSANLSEADLFVSIHCNASNLHVARGTETWYFNNSEIGRRLAESIHREIVKSVHGITNRGIKEGNFYVLRNTDMPAVLIETAFIDNPHDEDLLLKYTNEFAYAIAMGIFNVAE